MYLIRLDDASEYMDIEKWKRMEALLDKYDIKPIYGIIPNNEDSELLKYEKVEEFWKMMRDWRDKGWIPALHGFTHVFETDEGGINPVNKRSEFAGVALDIQKQKIREGYKILKAKGIEPKIFFAPAHTFDRNTLIALKEESPIRIICDTVANDIYEEDGVYFIPQQSGRCRKLPFRLTTFCYHPNIMEGADFDMLEEFFEKHIEKFSVFKNQMLKSRKYGIKDKLFRKIYFARRK